MQRKAAALAGAELPADLAPRQTAPPMRSDPPSAALNDSACLPAPPDAEPEPGSQHHHRPDNKPDNFSRSAPSSKGVR